MPDMPDQYSPPDQTQRYRGCLLGLAAGDAVGTTVEFRARGRFTPLTDMVGGGPFGLEPGQWTDDTSMALCLGHSLIEQNGFDAEDQMRRYSQWRQSGYMSSNGRCFDIGITVSEALNRFLKDGNPFAGSKDPYSAGNGSLMRLAPIPMFYSPNLEQVIRYAGESSRTTHGAEECIDACRYFATLLRYVLKNPVLKNRVLHGMDKEALLNCSDYQPKTSKVLSIYQGAYRQKAISEIKGSGYVVDCLEAALWCFLHTDNFADAILTAANLGDDADTTAAVCGQIAGAFYGVEGIPEHWRNKIAFAENIQQLADQLQQASLSVKE